MASSSVPGLDSIRDLFTSAERTVLEATAGRKLVAASRKQLEKTLALARTLRDKWRDQHAGQARKTKRAAGGAQANARSRTKADAFAAGIERIQARLTEFGHVPAPVRSQPGVTKAVRQAGHRSARARVRGSLAAAAADLSRGRGAAPAVKPAAVVARPAPAAPKKPAGRKMSKKRRPAATTAAVLATGGQPLRFDVAKQRSAKASATRMKLDGKVTRRGGHVLAAGKRRQAARDRRSR